MTKQILNFGSLNLDTVLSVSHIARPGETISAHTVDQFFGGKGFNQSIALARAGCQVFHAGKIGADGVALRRELEENGVNTRFLSVSSGRTGSAFIQRADSGENCIVLDGGTNRKITHGEIDSVLDAFVPGDVLVCQNEISGLPYLLNAAAQRGLLIALNPSPIDQALLDCDLSCVSWLVLNEIEGADITGEQAPESIAHELLARYPAMKVVLTLGEAGAVYADKAKFCRCPALPVHVVDTTAAGDTFLGYFLSEILHGHCAESALKTASYAAALAISVAGALPSIPTAKAVDHFMKGAV